MLLDALRPGRVPRRRARARPAPPGHRLRPTARGRGGSATSLSSCFPRPRQPSTRGERRARASRASSPSCLWLPPTARASRPHAGLGATDATDGALPAARHPPSRRATRALRLPFAIAPGPYHLSRTLPLRRGAARCQSTSRVDLRSSLSFREVRPEVRDPNAKIEQVLFGLVVPPDVDGTVLGAAIDEEQVAPAIDREREEIRWMNLSLLNQ